MNIHGAPISFLQLMLYGIPPRFAKSEKDASPSSPSLIPLPPQLRGLFGDQLLQRKIVLCLSSRFRGEKHSPDAET
jgi:hypothetical protein